MSATQTVTSALEERLRSDILKGILAPGAKLVVQRLQEQYGAGQNPLREALSRLTAEGLVRSEDQKGFTVASVSEQELEDLNNLRDLLECAAVAASVERGDEEWQGRVFAANRRLRQISVRDEMVANRLNDAWEEQHQAFHMTLVSACGSPWLIRFCRTVFEHQSRYRRLLLADEIGESVAMNVHRSHDEIVDAVLDRDVELTIARLRGNFVRAKDLSLTPLSRFTDAKPRSAAGSGRLLSGLLDAAAAETTATADKRHSS